LQGRSQGFESPRLHSETRSSGIIRLVAPAPRLLVFADFRLEPCLDGEAS
jgi:hypothetical protein